MTSYSINSHCQLRQSAEILNVTRLQTTQTEVNTCFIKAGQPENDVLVKITQQAFQNLSLVDIQPLDSTANKLCTVLIRKASEELNQSLSVKTFKNSLEILLNNFSDRITEPTNAAFIKALKHDLKHKNLTEIFNKYYNYATSSPIEKTLLFHFAPYLGNKDKIQLLAEKEAESLPEKIQSHLEFFATNRDELMTLLIKRKKDKNPKLNCYVIDICDLPTCVEGLKTLYHSLPSEKSQRIQLLVRNDVHYTGVDIDLSKKETQVAVMDAAGDPKCKEILSILKQLDCQFMYVLGLEDHIQFDNYNCGFFSFDSVYQSSQDPNFFDLLKKLPAEKKDHYYSLAWQNTPPRYVRNATSLTFMKKYHESNPHKDEIYKNNETFASFVNKHIDKRNINGNLKDAHTVLEDKVTKQKPKITLMLKELSARDLYDIINHHSAQALIQACHS